LRTKENVQFLDVFCIFQYQKNKRFSHFLDRDSKLTVYRDGAVRPLCKDNILFFVILRKSCGSGINIVLDKSDRMLILVIFSFYLKLNMSL